VAATGATAHGSLLSGAAGATAHGSLLSGGYRAEMGYPTTKPMAIEIVKLLVAHGADPAHRNNNGRTAADRATARGMLQVAELLRA